MNTKILVVEDDFIVGLNLETALTDAGYEVVGVAATADEALALAAATKPALAVMDVRLRGARDGVDVALDMFRTTGIRCIFATAHEDLATRARAQPAEPVGWMAKPYQLALLMGMIAGAVGPSD